MMSNKRREFLINTAIATTGLGLLKNQQVPADKSPSNNPTAIMCDKTTLDYYGEGPFYTDNPPTMVNHQLAKEDEPGTRMIISGRVFNLQCDQYIPNTIIDVWHANHDGQYDNEGFNLRGITQSNDQGFYLFETIKPGKYLNGNSYRPSHIHYKIKAPNQSVLTTQLYFEGDSSIPNDAAASITSGEYDATHRIIPLIENASGVLEGTFDVVIDGMGVAVGVQDIHIDKGMIYEISPNPMQGTLKIHYGVFKKSKVSLVVFNMEGREVAKLEDSVKLADKYYAYWNPGPYVTPGHYFVALKINDLQVHYLKIFKHN